MKRSEFVDRFSSASAETIETARQDFTAAEIAKKIAKQAATLALLAGVRWEPEEERLSVVTLANGQATLSNESVLSSWATVREAAVRYNVVGRLLRTHGSNSDAFLPIGMVSDLRALLAEERLGR